MLVHEIYGPRNPLWGFDSAANFTYLSDVSLMGTLGLDCQTDTMTTHAAWPQWLSEPGLDILSDPAVYLSWPAQKWSH